MNKQKVVIIGAGFAGISAMAKFARYPDIFDITLLTTKNHFEYYPGLYRLFGEHVPFEIFVPLRYMVVPPVTCVYESVSSVDTDLKKVTTTEGTILDYDTVIIATGSTPTDFGIPGVFEHAYLVSTLAHAKEAKKALLEEIQHHIITDSKEPYTIVIAGAGPTGVELAGELSLVLDTFAKNYHYPRSRLRIQMIQRGKSILPQLPRRVQKIALKRLKKIGVQVLLDTSITRVYKDSLDTSGDAIPFSFFFWTAGSQSSDLIMNTKTLPLSERKKVLVDKEFRVSGLQDVYVLGDNAETAFSGLAQIAEQDGVFVGNMLVSQALHKPYKPYNPREPIYVIPIGKRFGILGMKNKIFTGMIPWMLRYIVDARFFFFHLKFKDFISLSLERKLR